jgi:hypothetical protein
MRGSGVLVWIGLAGAEFLRVVSIAVNKRAIVSQPCRQAGA